ncbi:MAG: WavE lipopolysaccharide synthesis family protein [Hylemonella sp.]
MKDLTFVVQGKIQPNTKNCLASIRHFYPDSTIILSTWKGEPLAGLECDLALENDDPGAFEISASTYYNLNRQIISTHNGLKTVKTQFAVKMRTDTQILDTKIPILLENPTPAQLFQNKIIALNLFFRNPRKFPLLFHIGDIFQVGKTDDLLSLWDIPLASELEIMHWRTGHFDIFNDMRSWKFRYTPEQYIFIAFLAKHQIDASLQYCCEMDWQKASLSESLIAKNFRICTVEELGINIPSRLLIYMRSQDCYNQATLDNHSKKKTEMEFKGMIRRRKWRLIRKFIKSPNLWIEFLKSGMLRLT